jgi:hypothetical protein
VARDPFATAAVIRLDRGCSRPPSNCGVPILQAVSAFLMRSDGTEPLRWKGYAMVRAEGQAERPLPLVRPIRLGAQRSGLVGARLWMSASRRALLVGTALIAAFPLTMMALLATAPPALADGGQGGNANLFTSGANGAIGVGDFGAAGRADAACYSTIVKPIGIKWAYNTCSAGALPGPDFCFIFAPYGYDEPEILPS